MTVRTRIWILASIIMMALAWMHFEAQTYGVKIPGLSQLETGVRKLVFNAPKDFGKTHFIVGYPAQETAQHRSEQEEKSDNTTQETGDRSTDLAAIKDDLIHEGPYGLICQGHVKQVFFTPDDKVQEVLVHLIEQEKKSIKIAVFVFTDSMIAKALLAAHERGVRIELVVDATGLRDRFNKIKMLQEHGIPVFVYNTITDADLSGYMHNKFVLFAHNILQRPLIWTGSCNFTRSAHEKNQENVVLLDEAWLVNKYVHQFERLKKRSIAYRKGKASALA
jgi:phosphatidylserine/phosphatidylglycerophosphate/cardiolipin synthase-like enzyme